MRRVAITGIGILSALGNGKAAHLAAVEESRSGIRPLSRFDASGFLCRIAGEVPDFAMPPLPPELDRVSAYAIAAANEAMDESGLEGSLSPDRIAVLIGTALGGSETLDSGYQRLYEEGRSRLHPMTIPKSMYNAPASAIAARFGARGPAMAIVSACSSSAHAIGQAAHWIRFGLADTAIAGGADAPIAPGIVRAWEALRVLALDNDHPERACRPFSADRDGIVLAEGAGILVLEEMSRALGRGATILGEVAGFGMSSDAGHLTDPAEEGQARAMDLALIDAGLTPAEIGYLNAHGTGTRANDRAECSAIRRVFGDQASRLPVSSTKSMHGHAMGASGAIEIALSLHALNEGWIPPTLNLEQRDAECDLDLVPLTARSGRAAAFLSNSFGFGGLNAVLALKTRTGA
ncbi:MAG TPA: beta-ketoacyl-[acyl-carrier-protein] synthase family protein [Thermoanaerobaculia bacterium]|nr:beta-ketoacyl-[acyl-carrier-protein] synthase family protein [Thermoanaerobaculia bacterium]